MVCQTKDQIYGKFGHMLRYSYLPEVEEVTSGLDSVAKQNIRQGLHSALVGNGKEDTNIS